MADIYTNAVWRLRALVSPETRRMIRRLSDPWVGPIGSIVGARTGDLVTALTFDDGPEAGTTQKVLDTLARHDAKATFFVLLDRAEMHSDSLRRMVAEGHEIGLHGVDHLRLTEMKPARASEHIRDGVRRLQAITGSRPKWFRPPYGAQSFRTYLAARGSGMEVVAWSADCADWTNEPTRAIADLALARLRPGGVLLMHDATDPDETRPVPPVDRPTLVDLVLSGMRDRGYSAVSMSNLLKGRRAHRTAWFRP